MKTMNVEPAWNSMFGLAVQVVKDGLPKDKGRDFVVEMLEFGGRLNESHEECIRTKVKEVKHRHVSPVCPPNCEAKKEME